MNQLIQTISIRIIEFILIISIALVIEDILNI